MAVLSIQEMLKLKGIVKDYGFILHIHDACGGQSFTLEKANDNPDEQVYTAIESFFTEHQMKVHFYDDKRLNFVAK